MDAEKIQVRVTSSGQTLHVVVLNKRLDRRSFSGKASTTCDAN
jgi:hypothetical protein